LAGELPPALADASLIGINNDALLGVTPTLSVGAMLNVVIPQEYQGEEWVRLPKPGERRLGMARSSWMDLIKNPKAKIRSIVIKQPGAQRGIRLVFLPSVRGYFEKLAAEQNNAQACSEAS